MFTSFDRADAYELYVGQTQPKVGAKRECLLDALIWFVRRDHKQPTLDTFVRDLDDFVQELSRLQIAPADVNKIGDSATPSSHSKAANTVSPRNVDRKNTSTEIIVIDSDSETETPLAKSTPRKHRAGQYIHLISQWPRRLLYFSQSPKHLSLALNSIFVVRPPASRWQSTPGDDR